MHVGSLPVPFKVGAFICFEGPDGTGKSTQLDRMEAACLTPQMGDRLFAPEPLFTHQPSGASGIGPSIYALTESVDWSVGEHLTRQFLHLAAHVEHYCKDILPALKHTSVWMDRCWWSTVAYGWSDQLGNDYDITFEEFVDLAQLPTKDRLPDLVYLFTHRYDEKKLSPTDRKVIDNYLLLASLYPETTILVPRGGVGDTQAFITSHLIDRGFVNKEDIVHE